MEDRNRLVFAKAFDEGASQAELERRASGLKEVQELFVKKGDTYRYKDEPSITAFTETDLSISTNLDNDEVAIAMTKVAQSKGWGYFVADGSQTFYDTVAKQTEKLTVEHEQLAIREQTTQENAVQAQNKKPALEPDDSKLTNEVKNDSEQTELESKEKNRREAIATSVNDKYRVAGNKYYFKDQAGNVNQLAFKDSGNKLSTALNSERVTQSLVDMAYSKGWKTIKVSGHSEFKRQVWRAAAERGIKTKGYTPDVGDLAIAERTPDKNAPRISKPEKNDTRKVQGVTTGVLVAHGEAPYQHESSNSASYFITVKSGNTERTAWGIGLPDALQKSGVQIGDNVNLRKKSDRAQTQGLRNEWSIERTDKKEVITAVASAVAAKSIKKETDRQRFVDAVTSRMDNEIENLPNVQIYDNNATQSPSIEKTSNRQKTPELVR